MTLVARRDYFRCDYCTTLHFPEPPADSPDRVTPLGETAPADCPLCTAPLIAAALDGTRVLFCPACRGILAQSEAFAQIVRNRRAKYKGAESSPVPVDRTEFERRVDCPACRSRMDVHPYYGPGNAVIDSCGRCRLVWLDHGELAHIERASGRR